MRGGKQKPRGYTIVEVMVFLAVSGVMFLLAATFISGKQEVIDFRQSMHDVGDAITATMNEVSNGDYLPLGGNTCSATKGNAPVIVSGAGNGQGSNGGIAADGTTTGCIFLGKVMQFEAKGDATTFGVYTVAARQLNGTLNPVQTFAEAMPIAIDTQVPATSTVNLTVFKTLTRGLVLTNSLECTANCSSAAPTYQPLGAFGFFGGFGGYITTPGSPNVSGAQSIIAAAVPNTTVGEPYTTFVQALNSSSGLGAIGSAGQPNSIISGGRELVLCFKNGTHKGSVTIGGSNGQAVTADVSLGDGVPQIC